MIDYKILSRKLLLTVALPILATVLIMLKMPNGSPVILDYQWQAVITATIISYIVGANVQNKRVEVVYIKSLKERLRDLFKWDFILAVITIAATTLLLLKGRVSNNVWFAIVSPIAAAYNVMNPISKT